MTWWITECELSSAIKSRHTNTHGRYYRVDVLDCGTYSLLGTYYTIQNQEREKKQHTLLLIEYIEKVWSVPGDSFFSWIFLPHVICTAQIFFLIFFFLFLPLKNWIKNVFQLEKKIKVLVCTFVFLFFRMTITLMTFRPRLLFAFILFITHTHTHNVCVNWHVSRKNQWTFFSFDFIIVVVCLFCSCLNLFYIFHILLAIPLRELWFNSQARIIHILYRYKWIEYAIYLFLFRVERKVVKNTLE